MVAHRMAEQKRECDVVVVGAGFSGLAAARQLHRAGLDVLVLEGRHRIGGRSFTDVTPAGFTIDRGGQWIGPTQDHVAALAGEFGVRTFLTWTTGQGIELRDGARHPYVGLIPTSDPEGAAEGIATMLDLDLAALDLPLHEPWDLRTPPPSTGRPWPAGSTVTSSPRRPGPSSRWRSRRSSARGRGSCRCCLRSFTSGRAAAWPTWPGPPAGLRRAVSTAAPCSWPRAWAPSWGTRPARHARRRHRLRRHATDGVAHVSARAHVVAPRARSGRPHCAPPAPPGPRPPRHRGPLARPLRPHRLLAAAPERSRPAHPAHAHGCGDQGARLVRQTLLARRRAQRPDRGPRRAHGERLRQLARGRRARRARSASSRATTAGVPSAAPRRPPGRRAGRPGPGLRTRAAQPVEYVEQQWCASPSPGADRSP